MSDTKNKQRKRPPAFDTPPAPYQIHRPDVAAIDSRPVANGVEMGSAFVDGLTSHNVSQQSGVPGSSWLSDPCIANMIDACPFDNCERHNPSGEIGERRRVVP